MYQAIQNNKLEEIKSLLNNGTDVNAPLWTTGEFAGYTALHIACMENKDEVVELLITDYKANFNLVAEDGTLPIHLVCFYEPYTFEMTYNTNFDKLYFLLNADANADVEFGPEIFEKHVKDQEWCPDFEKMTPLIYTIVYKKPDLACALIQVSSNLKMKSLKNKTLLMYALEYDLRGVVSDLIDAIEDPEYMNLKDDDGIPTIHYVLYPKKYNQFRYESRELRFLTYNKRMSIVQLIKAGADKHALVNNDPDTFLPNVAAYRSCSSLLEGLLTYYEFMPLSKVLYNAILPIDDNINKMVRQNLNNQALDDAELMRRIRRNAQATIEVAVKHLVIRRTFGLHTNKEEMKLMENLIATDEKIKSIVDDYEGKFINGELKTKLVDVNGKKISVLDFLKQVFDDKKLKLWAGDENICDWNITLNKEESYRLDYDRLNRLTWSRIENGCERFKLLKKLDETSTLRKFIDLPYEIVLEFVEYLNNDELNAFIKAFIS